MAEVCIEDLVNEDEWSQIGRSEVKVEEALPYLRTVGGTSFELRWESGLA